MCGIALYADFIHSPVTGAVFDHLYHALLLLINRGYDSCGIASMSAGTGLHLTKTSLEKENPVERMRTYAPFHHNAQVGMVHTRWATHGSKTDRNAHPHVSKNRRIAVVHNGIIDNYLSLQEEYQLDPETETDTEIVALLMEKMLENYDGFDAFRRTIEQLNGTWAIIMLCEQYPQSIFVSVNGSPLVTGVSEGAVMMLASEPSVLAQHYNSWVPVPDGTCFEIFWKSDEKKWKIAFVDDSGTQRSVYTPGGGTANGGGPDTSGTRDSVHDPSGTATSAVHIPLGTQTEDFCSYWPRYKMFPLEAREEIRSRPGHFAHWTLKEIMEQPHTISSAMNFGGRFDGTDKVKLGGLERGADLLTGLKHLLLIGCGTSYHAAMVVGAFVKKFSIFESVYVIDASEFEAHDIPHQGAHVVAWLFTQSGETRDVVRALDLLQEQSSVTIGIINSVGSLIARRVDCGSYINAGREVGVASTKSFTSQVVVGLLVSLWFVQNMARCSSPKGRRCYYIQQLRALPKIFSSNLKPLQQYAEKIAHYLLSRRFTRSIFILGRGYAYPLALEGSLKLKELTYIHVEAQCLGSLKHGPFAVLQEDVPVFVLAFTESDLARHVSAVHEIHSRGSPVIVVTRFPREKGFVQKSQFIVHVDSDDALMASLGSAIFFQFLAYHLSVQLGHNPDMPRNLAKCVTVDG
jgi:glutamine---fructose-6-phosphate transaminase (isomerizing)